MNKQIRKAVFPVAGLGTRFLPATKASPKEMLAVVDKPLIQYAVEEAYSAGIRQMIFVTGRNKRSIEDHFDVAYELEAELHSAGKTSLQELLQTITPSDMECIFIRQPRALGLGHAVLCAESVIAGEPFAVLLADELTVSNPPALAQMTSLFDEQGHPVLGLKRVLAKRAPNYGIVSGESLGGGVIKIQTLIEKPKLGEAPSDLAISGRYLLNSSIFSYLRKQGPGISGEIQLTDALNDLVSSEIVYGLEYSGLTYDCGTKLGFLQAGVDIGLSHPETGAEFTEWLSDMLR